jgi:hypothetical protein
MANLAITKSATRIASVPPKKTVLLEEKGI